MTRVRLGLLPVFFCLFVTELWPLIYIRISFPFNILTSWQNLTEHLYWQDLGWDCNLSFFRKFGTELWSLSDVRISFSLNILRTNRGSYMIAHVLLNLLNELGKRDKMWGLPSILSLFRNEFNKFNYTRARMLDSIYHMTNTLKSRFWRKNVIILSLCTQRCYGRHNVSRKSINH